MVGDEFFSKESVNAYTSRFDSGGGKFLSDFELWLWKKLIPKKEYKNVLDIGSGLGRISKFILDNYNIKNLHCLDESKNMLKYTKNKTLKNRKNVKYIESNIFDFKSNKKFDLILMAHVLKHVPSLKVFNKISKVLNKGGVFIFDFNIYSFLWDYIFIILFNKMFIK